MRLPPGTRHVDSWTSTTQYPCGNGEYYTIVYANANTNTIQGWDWTSATSFFPTGQCRSIHLSLFCKHENGKKQRQCCWSRNSKRKTMPQDYCRCLSCQSPSDKKNEQRNPDDVANNLHQHRKREVTCLNRPSQRLSRLHPFTMRSAFESGHDEFSHRKGIERPEHSGSSFLLAAFEQLDVKSWIVQHSAHAPASQIFL